MYTRPIVSPMESRTERATCIPAPAPEEACAEIGGTWASAPVVGGYCFIPPSQFDSCDELWAESGSIIVFSCSAPLGQWEW